LGNGARLSHWRQSGALARPHEQPVTGAKEKTSWEWAKHCDQIKQAAKVIPMRRKAKAGAA
jgi:hypothetical protein